MMPTPRSNPSIPPASSASPDESGGVIPIRGMTPATPQPAIRPRTSEPTARPKNVPVEARPWRILLVPPTPGARTRALDLAQWQRRTLIGGFIALVVVAAAAVTTIVVGMSSEDLFAPSAGLASIRGRLVAVEDSLTQARAALATAEDLVHGPRSVGDLPDARQRLLNGAAPSMAGLSSDGLPVNGTITSDFSTARRHPLLKITRPHLGVDITAPPGSRISAPAAGRVSFVGWKFALGLLVEIQHPNGVVTRYAHCRMALVKTGDRVSRGTMIATVGSSGLTTGPHLHYEVWHNGNAINPLRFRFPIPADSVRPAGG